MTKIISLMEAISEHPTLGQAYLYARKAHEGITDDNGDGYFDVHLRQVASCLAVVSPGDPNLIAAGLLHDTIEDTDVTYEELHQKFGADVADLVMEVTHEEANEYGWGYYFPRLKSKRGITLKFADRLSNLGRMMSWSQDRIDHYLRRSRFWKWSEGECPTCHGKGTLG